MDDRSGAIIESGLSDWQIIQQDASGHGAIELAGRWVRRAECQSNPFVQVRVVFQDTAAPVLRSLDWRKAEMLPGEKWKARIDGIPAGGLYRVETNLHDQDAPQGDWAMRGDMRHCVGVGDIWVIAGQSNSAGYGRGPVHDPSELGLHLFRNNDTWAIATHPMNESTDTTHIVNRELANPGHSPYLNFARVLRQHLGYPIGLIQTSLGGSPLTSWNPTEPGESGLFDSMVTTVQRAGGAVKGIVWYQGESDASPENASTYEARFTSGVEAWRKALGNPELAVATVQLNRVKGARGAGNETWTRVREAQRQAGRKIPGVTVVPSHDQDLTDVIHISPAGNMVLGDRLARAVLQKIHARDVDGLAPDLIEAKSAENGSAVTLRFENVSSFLGTIDLASQPYRVDDADGENPVTEIGYPAFDTVQLTLTRPIAGKATVHGGWGDDPQILAMDMQRIQPVLAFSAEV